MMMMVVVVEVGVVMMMMDRVGWVMAAIDQRQRDSLVKFEKSKGRKKNQSSTKKRPNARVESSLSVIVYPLRQCITKNNTASCNSAAAGRVDFSLHEAGRIMSYAIIIRIRIRNLMIRASVAIWTQILLCASESEDPAFYRFSQQNEYSEAFTSRIKPRVLGPRSR